MVPYVSIFSIEDLKGCFLDNISTTHQCIMKLNTGELMNTRSFFDFYFLYRSEIIIQRISIHTCLHLFLNTGFSTVSKCKTNRSFRLSWHDINRNILYYSVTNTNIHIATVKSAICNMFVHNSHSFGICLRHGNVVIPTCSG